MRSGMKLADELEMLSTSENHKNLRFSKCRAGLYEWGSVRTDCMDVARFLCLCWNERATIIKALHFYHNKGDGA